jgi:DNA-binding IclR family transcriptional regulator
LATKTFAVLPGKTSSQLSRFLKRLRLHGLVHKIPRSYRYRLSLFGQTVITLAFKLKDLVIIPELAAFAHP